MTDGLDMLIHWMSLLYEVNCGVTESAEKLRGIRTGELKTGIPVQMITDSRSLYDALSAEHVKQPSEKNLHMHLLWIRELLDRHIISKLIWVDTRDMVADGLTKGCISRSAIIDLLSNARWKPENPIASWQSPIKKTTI